MNGLMRYNAIQSALSPIRKQKGWKMPVGGFQGIASKIYQHTKKEPLKQVLSNMDILVEDLPYWNAPFIPDEFLEPHPFFEFDVHAHNGLGIYNPELLSNDLYVKSPQLQGEEFIISADLLSYEDHFSSFSDFCNANQGYWWFHSGDAPTFHFTPPKFDFDEQKYITILELGQDDGYGFEPGIGGVVKEEIKIKEPEKIEEAVPPPEKPLAELEIEKIKAETERLKASKDKLEELNKAVDRLDSQLDRGLITKQEYKTYLKRLYEF